MDDGFNEVMAYFNDFWGGCIWYPSAVREHTYYVCAPGPFHPYDFETITEACYAMGWEVLSVAAGNMPGYFEFMLIPKEVDDVLAL